ncbi:hypothetical protein NCS52_01190600 [Fusarium sp. LHS14.1]|nr:hypothetical protein NCS52_01190600 [Fusarium sp. LHS14.1]
MSFPPSIYRAYQLLPATSRRADKSIVEEPPFYYATGRCRLCQFSIRDGEFVVTQIGPERFSPAFAFRVDDAVRSNEPRRHRIDRLGSNAVRLFHSSCIKFKHFVITDDLLAVTEHSIGLSEWEER